GEAEFDFPAANVSGSGIEFMGAGSGIVDYLRPGEIMESRLAGMLRRRTLREERYAPREDSDYRFLAGIFDSSLPSFRLAAERIPQVAGGHVSAGDWEASHRTVSEHAAFVVAGQSAVHNLSRVGDVVWGADLRAFERRQRPQFAPDPAV